LRNITGKSSKNPIFGKLTEGINSIAPENIEDHSLWNSITMIFEILCFILLFVAFIIGILVCVPTIINFM